MKPLVWSFAVFVAVILTYLPSTQYEFVGHDDHEYVYENSHVLSGLSLENVRWALNSCGYAYNWHPLTWLSLQLDASLVKDQPVALSGCRFPDDSFKTLSSVMHTHNVLIHAANAALLFLLIIFMLKGNGCDSQEVVSFPVFALIVLSWAIHPLRTEIVCWVSERKELLSVFWMLMTLIFWIGKQSAICYVIALVCFVLALMAKPVAVTLPAVLFAWDWVMSGRSIRKSLTSIIPFCVLAMGAITMTFAAQVRAIDVGKQFCVWEKVARSLSAPVIYLRQTFWPVGLSAIYSAEEPVSWIELCLGVALFIGMISLFIVWLKRRRPYALSLLVFAIAWSYISLTPMLGVVKVGDQPHSDRYTYWVGCGLATVAALAAFRYLKGSEKKEQKVLAVIVAVLVVATRVRMPVWRNSLSFYADAAVKSWADPPVRAFSQILRQQGRNGEKRAEAMLREALTRTHSREISAELAHLLACRTEKSVFLFGDDDPAFEEARFEAMSVLSANSDHARANEALAIVEMKEGKWESALQRLELLQRKYKDIAHVNHYISICRERLAVDRGGDVQR